MGRYAAVSEAHERITDAIKRALMTFYVSVGVDVAATIGLGFLQLMASTDVMTPAFWLAAGGLVLKSLVTGIATFFIRLKFPAVKYGERPV